MYYLPATTKTCRCGSLITDSATKYRHLVRILPPDLYETVRDTIGDYSSRFNRQTKIPFPLPVPLTVWGPYQSLWFPMFNAGTRKVSGISGATFLHLQKAPILLTNTIRILTDTRTEAPSLLHLTSLIGPLIGLQRPSHESSSWQISHDPSAVPISCTTGKATVDKHTSTRLHRFITILPDLGESTGDASVTGDRTRMMPR